MNTRTLGEIRALCTARVPPAPPPETVFAAIADPARLARWRGELALLLAPQVGGTHIGWRQTFPSAEHCARMAPLCAPSNEQNLDRLAAVLAEAGDR